MPSHSQLRAPCKLSSPSWAIPLLIVLGVTGWLSHRMYWVSDDAYISFRYAKHLARGDGLRFNVGEAPPVEGYTNFLWVLLSAAGEGLGIASDILMPALSVLCALVIMWRLYLIATRSFSLPPFVAGSALLILACQPPFVIWSTSGLETMAFTLLILLTTEALFLNPTTPLRWAASYGVLLCLVRAEGPAWALCIGGLAFLLRQERRSVLARFVLPILIVSLAYLLFRLWYFGEWFPNTANAKVQSGPLVWERGLRYLLSFWLSFITPFVLILLTPLARRSVHSRLVEAAVLVTVGFYVFVVIVGGDFMSMGRFLVPTLPLQMIVVFAVAAKLVNRPARWTLRGLPVAVALIVAAISILPLAGVYLVPQSVRAAYHFRWNRGGYIDEVSHWRFMQKNTRHWQMKAKAISFATRPGESMIVGPIGNMGYFTELFFYDCYGLTTKLDRSLFSQAALQSPGHDMKVPPRYFLDKQPTYFDARVTKRDKLPEILARRAKYPPQYAPVVTPLPASVLQRAGHFVVMLKRFDSPESAAEQWGLFQQQWVMR